VQPEPALAAEPARHSVHEPSSTAGADDAIYQKMLSEWLVDPTEIAKSEDLNWERVWDQGWSAAAAAEDAPVTKTTEEGLPLREPGARLVPGAVDYDEVASAAEFDTGGQPIPPRDPDAVRASISSHFGGVHAGRSHAQETRGTE
jgi:hypothetical protein